MSSRKVAITTWFHYHNYGTALQVVALSEVVKQLGYQPDVVNYIPHGTRYSDEKATDWSEAERVIDESRSERFDGFIKKNLSFTKSCVNDVHFEALSRKYHAFIAGSDQIWSPTVFDSRYYLDYVADNRKKIGYAPSMGVTEVRNKDIERRMTLLMSQFAQLSAREEAGGQLIKKMTGRRAELVLDPTFLLDYSAWRKIIPIPKSLKKQKYILCYFLGDNKNSWAHAKKIAKEKGLSIKILPVFKRDEAYGEFEMAVGPEEFFNIIDSAEIVLTDSFHGVIFSMLCMKEFYAFERFRADDPLSQNSRLYNILNFTKQQSRLISYDEPIRTGYSRQIDYNAVNKIIQQKRNDSLEYLRRSLDIEQPLVSVVVPVYNVEKYISKCLDSILAQTYRNIEVIVVDDGTPDRAGDIADDYSRKDKRLKVIHGKNSGLPTARNRGYDVSSGKYVMFVDSDDALAPNAIEYMLGLIEATGTNVAMSLSQYDVFHQDQVVSDKVETVGADTVLKNIEYSIWPQEVWNKIYRRSFLEKYRIRHIPEILYGEGNTFNHHVLEYSGDVGVGYRRVYYYRYNPESSTRKFVWGERVKSLEYALRYRQEVVDKKGRDVKIAFQYHKWNAAMHILKGLLSIDGDKKHRSDYRKWRRVLRSGVAGVLLADKNLVPWKMKKRALKSYFFPRATIVPFLHGFEWERAQEKAFRQIDDADFDVMPWDVQGLKTGSGEDNITVEGLLEENLRLTNEINSFLSIRRSFRLLLGNIKRRIKYGKNR